MSLVLDYAGVDCNSPVPAGARRLSSCCVTNRLLAAQLAPLTLTAVWRAGEIEKRPSFAEAAN